MPLRRFLSPALLLVGICVPLVVVFQDCTGQNVSLTSLPSTVSVTSGGIISPTSSGTTVVSNGPVAQGGSGTDGMRYINFAICPDTTFGDSDEIVVSASGHAASLVRQNCKVLASPVDVTSQIVGQAAGSKNLIWNGLIFDLAVVSGQQAQTDQYCTGSSLLGEAAFVRHWHIAGNSNQAYASVTNGDGTGTGAVKVDSNSSFSDVSNSSYDSDSEAGSQIEFTASPLAVRYTLGNPNVKYSLGSLVCTGNPH